MQYRQTAPVKMMMAVVVVFGGIGKNGGCNGTYDAGYGHRGGGEALDEYDEGAADCDGECAVVDCAGGADCVDGGADGDNGEAVMTDMGICVP